MPCHSARLDQILQALADPTRRAVLRRLNAGSASTLEFARPFAMALPSFTQPLKMLEKAGPVSSRKSGRVRTFELVPKPLAAVEDWILDRRRVWERRLDQLDACLPSMKEHDDEQ